MFKIEVADIARSVIIPAFAAPEKYPRLWLSFFVEFEPTARHFVMSENCFSGPFCRAAESLSEVTKISLAISDFLNDPKKG